RRVERQELAKLVDGEHERFRRALAQIRVADAKLGVGTIRTLHVGLDHLLEELARQQPFLLVDGGCPFVEQKPVGLARAWRHDAAPAGPAARGSQCDHEDEQTSGAIEQRRLDHKISSSQWYSAANPCSSPTAGAKPRSARARPVSA